MNKKKTLLRIISGYAFVDHLFYKPIARPFIVKYLGIDLGEPIWDHIDHEIYSSRDRIYCRTCKRYI